MLGYPWESKADVERTISLIKELFDKGWANSMQCTLLMPYPGTALFREAQEKGWLLTTDWSLYTMGQRILNCPLTDQEVLDAIQQCYRAAVTPKYVLRKVINIRTKDDFRFLWRGLRFLLGHLTDFDFKRTKMVSSLSANSITKPILETDRS